MIGTIPGHPFPSSRRRAAISDRSLAQAMGVELHGRRPPGLPGSLAILAVIALFVAGLLWGPLDLLVGLVM